MRLIPVFGGPPTPALLWWISGLILVIEAVSQLGDRGLFGGFDLRAELLSRGAFWGDLFPPGSVGYELYPSQSYVMLVSHVFLHAGTIHVLMNTAILIALSKTLAIHLGLRFVLITMGLGAISGGLFFGFLTANSAPMVGASGMAFSLIGLWLFTTRLEVSIFRTPKPSITPILTGLILAHVILHIVMGGRIAWQAHLGGFVIGYFVMPQFLRFSTRQN